jgi:hypothetical protein
LFDHFFEIGKSLMGRWCSPFTVRCGGPFELVLLVLIIVAVDAQKLPVAAVGWVVVVVVVLVMDREFAELLPLELTTALAADRREQLQRLLAVSLFPQLTVLSGLGDDPILSVLSRSLSLF